MVCAAAAVPGRQEGEWGAMQVARRGDKDCANASAHARGPSWDSSEAWAPTNRSYDTSFRKASVSACGAASSTRTSEIMTSEPVSFHINVDGRDLVGALGRTRHDKCGSRSLALCAVFLRDSPSGEARDPCTSM